MASLTSEQFQAARALLKAHPEGLTIPDIRAVLEPKPDPRTLRDLLESLNGQVVRIDATQHTVRYYALRAEAAHRADLKSQISDFKPDTAAPAANPTPPATPRPAAAPPSTAVPSSVATSVSEWPLGTPPSAVNTAPPPPTVSEIENRDSKMDQRPPTGAPGAGPLRFAPGPILRIGHLRLLATSRISSTPRSATSSAPGSCRKPRGFSPRTAPARTA